MSSNQLTDRPMVPSRYTLLQRW